VDFEERQEALFEFAARDRGADAVHGQDGLDDPGSSPPGITPHQIRQG
jgi:hypothetical protein